MFASSPNRRFAAGGLAWVRGAPAVVADVRRDLGPLGSGRRQEGRSASPPDFSTTPLNLIQAPTTNLDWGDLRGPRGLKRRRTRISSRRRSLFVLSQMAQLKSRTVRSAAPMRPRGLTDT
jgi:hypothetical protein